MTGAAADGGAEAAAAGADGSLADAAGAAAAGAAFASAAGGCGLCDVHAVASSPVSTMYATCFAISFSFEVEIPTLSAGLEPVFNRPWHRP